MNIFQVIIMALKSLMSNKVRSLLTMIGVIIGVASVITLVSVMSGVAEINLSKYYSLGVNQIQAFYYGENSDFEEIFNDFIDENLSEHVDYVLPVTTGNPTILYGDKTLQYSNVFYTDQNYIIANELSLKYGRNLALGDIKSRTKVAIIGSYIRDQFFSGIASPVGKSIKLNGEEYLIVGLLEEKYGGLEWSQDNAIIIPHTTSIYNENMQSNSQYIVVTKDEKSTTYVETYINENFPMYFDDSWNFWAYSDKEWLDNLQKEQQTMTLAAGAVGGISLIVGGIGIMNIMLVSVTERTREIGIRMSIGAKRRNIIIQFLIEAGTVSGFGGILGIVLGSFLTTVIGSFITQEAVITPSVPVIISSFIFSVLLGIFFGLYPANKASKLNPIDALRSQ